MKKEEEEEEEVELAEFIFPEGPYKGRPLSSVPRSYISSDIIYWGTWGSYPGLKEALLKNGSLVEVVEDGKVEEGEIPVAVADWVVRCPEGWRVPKDARKFLSRWGPVWITTRDSKIYFGLRFLRIEG